MLTITEGIGRKTLSINLSSTVKAPKRKRITPREAWKQARRLPQKAVARALGISPRALRSYAWKFEGKKKGRWGRAPPAEVIAKLRDLFLEGKELLENDGITFKRHEFEAEIIAARIGPVMRNEGFARSWDPRKGAYTQGFAYVEIIRNGNERNRTELFSEITGKVKFGAWLPLICESLARQLKKPSSIKAAVFLRAGGIIYGEK